MEDKGLITQITSIVLDNLSSRGIISASSQTFKNTETILYNINKMKSSITDKEDEINELKSIGLKNRSKSITTFTGKITNINKDEEEIIEEYISNIRKEIFKLKLLLDHIMRAISKFSNDEWYDIITYKYIDNLGIDEIVKAYEKKGIKTNPSSISRNKNRLINELRISLFASDFLVELLKK